MFMKSPRKDVVTLLCAALLAACSDGTGPLIPTTVRVTAPSNQVQVGSTLQLNAAVLDQNGAAMTGNTVSWSSENNQVASVSGTGMVTGTGAGQVRITATSGSLTGSWDVTVTSIPCSLSTTAAITPGQTVNGQLNASDCTLPDGTFADGYRLVLPAGAIVQIAMNSSQFDAYLLLTREDLAIIDEDDDSGGGSNAFIFRPLAAGTYVIWANSYAPGETGAYQLTVSVAAPCTVTGSVAVGSTAVGALANTDCAFGTGKVADWWSVQVTTPLTLRFDLASTEFDAYLYLLSAEYEVLAQDDDGGTGTDSRITRTMAPGAYYAVVTSYDVGERGAYSLAVSSVAVASPAAVTAAVTAASPQQLPTQPRPVKPPPQKD
jgi:hypothetical protein